MQELSSFTIMHFIVSQSFFLTCQLSLTVASTWNSYSTLSTVVLYGPLINSTLSQLNSIYMHFVVCKLCGMVVRTFDLKSIG